MIKNIFKKLILPVIMLIVGGGAVWLYLTPAKVAKVSCDKDYPFISSEIDCKNIDEKVDQIEILHSGIENIIDQAKKDNQLIRASVFYRDLNTRRWFGVNDIDKFYPASLIKLPIAIMYYKMSEIDPSLMDKTLQIPEDVGDNSDQYYKPADPLLPGKTYQAREMIRHMLQYSDNAPFSTIADSGGAFREKVLSDLSIYEPSGDGDGGTWSVTARNYANIFRMLFNASYVDMKSANDILSILSQSSFTNGLVAGVPKEVRVAHKFGEAAGVDKNNSVRSLILSDCGIVYRDDSPYIICVMVEGHSYPELEKIIQHISEAAYNGNI